MRYFFKVSFILILLLRYFNPTPVQAQKNESNYSLANIPNQLFIGSNKIIREEVESFEILSETEAKHKVDKVVTILNEQGNQNHDIRIYYDQFREVKNVSGTIYDKNGKFIRKLKKFDIEDRSAISGYSLYEDSRIKKLKIKHDEYPFTYKISYEIETSDLLHLQQWHPINSPHTSIEQSQFKVTIPSEIKIRYKEYNHLIPASIDNIEGKTIYTWHIENCRAIPPEPMINLSSISPAVFIALNKFSYAGIRGNCKNWQELGSFFYQLNKGQNELPDELKKELDERIDESQPHSNIVNQVYQFLHENTRYVSIQLGYGNLKTLSSAQVYSDGYGDCKALSNYMGAILNYFNITSHIALVEVGNFGNMDDKFPSDQFNHAILCVPDNGDTVWIDTTDPSLPFGYLGAYAMGKTALLITENGGVLRKTPSFKPLDNARSINVKAQLFVNGSAVFITKIDFKNSEFEMIKQLEGDDEIKKHIYSISDFDDIQLNSMDAVIGNAEQPIYTIIMSIKSNRFSTNNGEYIYFQPTVFNRQKKVVSPNQKRQSPFQVSQSHYFTDSIYYLIPEQFEVESIPSNVKIENDFGAYEVKYETHEDGILFIRKWLEKEGRFEKEKYKEYLIFKNKMAEIDQYKIILSKNKKAAKSD